LALVIAEKTRAQDRTESHGTNASKYPAIPVGKLIVVLIGHGRLHLRAVRLPSRSLSEARYGCQKATKIAISHSSTAGVAKASDCRFQAPTSNSEKVLTHYWFIWHRGEPTNVRFRE
jgi:hypothetical protein